MYRLQVTRFEDNPEYRDQIKQYREAIRYNHGTMDRPSPQQQIEKTYLNVVVTDEEYAVIKKEVIKVS